MIRADVFVELRLYLNVLRRRWPLVLIPTIIVLAIGILTFSIPPTSYTATMHYIVSQEPTESADIDESSRRFVWVTSQYVVNSITDWTSGTDFAGRIAFHVNEAGIDITMAEVASSLESDTERSQLELVFAHSDPDTLEAIVEAATRVLNEDNATAIPQLGAAPARLVPIDQIVVTPIGPGLSALIDLPLRVFVAIAAGIGLALLIEYLDPKIHTRSHMRSIKVPVLAEIPSE